MLKRFSYLFAYLLLVLMPIQGFAAASMSICNSTMQSKAQQVMQNMPCHDDVAKETSKHAPEKRPDFCKTVCATLCASLYAMTALPSNLAVATFFASSELVHFPQQNYVSITQPNLQRPPIFLA
jgi:hypothetical protein